MSTSPQGSDDVPTSQELEAIAEDPQSTPSATVIDISMAEQHVLDAIQARDQRKIFAEHILMVAKAWLVVLGYILIAQGFGHGFLGYGRFHLSDNVLLALLTTSTGTVIGVLIIVVRYLFPRR